MSRGLGIIQQQILALIPEGEIASTDYLRNKIYPNLFTERNPQDMNYARVTIHRAVETMIKRGILKKLGKNKRGCTMIQRTHATPSSEAQDTKK